MPEPCMEPSRAKQSQESRGGQSMESMESMESVYLVLLMPAGAIDLGSKFDFGKKPRHQLMQPNAPAFLIPRDHAIVQALETPSIG